jgi:periplasmic divalent cation tolerance protein
MSETARDGRVALMTAPDPETAARIVRALVDERLVACGNIVSGLTSIYRWEGEIQVETEVLMVLKTTAAAVPGLLERAPALHPYDVPEVLVLPVEAGHTPYLAWIDANVETAEDKN